jgi:hypothetical protein
VARKLKKNYHIIAKAVTKSNRKILHIELLSCLGTGRTMKKESGGVKLDERNKQKIAIRIF